MLRLTPEGTATRRFRRESAASAESDPRPASDPAGDLRDVEDFEPAYLGWELVRCAPGLSAEEAQVVAAIAAAVIASIQAGSTRLPVHGPSLATLLGPAGTPQGVAIAQRLLEQVRAGGTGAKGSAGAPPNHPVCGVIGVPGERKPLLIEGPWLYSERMFALEVSFCARIAERAADPLPPKDARSLARVVAAVGQGPPALTDEQKHAVREALRPGLALITGGPGTGKTMTVVALVSALSWMGVPLDAVAIAAPTGKAAQRLSAAIATGLASPGGDIAQAALGALVPTPMTLHRLLGWSPTSGRYAHHENNPLPHRVVIVDEASMIDLALMDRLVRAVRKDGRLVLLGDADQLPSVDAGAVFRDLCAALGSARLGTNLRVTRDVGGQAIVAAAEAVNRGVIGATATKVRAPAALTFAGVELLDALWSEVGESFLDLWWQRHLAADPAFLRRARRTYKLEGDAFGDEDQRELRALFGHYGTARILCATRSQGAPASADAINQSLLNRLRGAGGIRRAWRSAADFAPGAPVMVQRNDYARGLFNGDQGLVVRVDAGDANGPRLTAVFARGETFAAFAADANADLAPAFAMTVHKAQGSEFESVALVLPESEGPVSGLLTRELVYTAMTRARRSVVLVAPWELVTRAVSRTVQRHSGVAERLAKFKKPVDNPQ